MAAMAKGYEANQKDEAHPEVVTTDFSSHFFSLLMSETIVPL